ncbi:unnamed protein product [Clavelina lepadiformis]|uniref:Uncharacterized protein n=1 Tax=Clavelina lepadiformis TaxID=159417 RepID=A0ABP0GRU5_CLALP
MLQHNNMKQTKYEDIYGKQLSNPCNQYESALERQNRYLYELAQHNKILKNAKIRDKEQEEKEKKEKGFSVYVNGANAIPRKAKPSLRHVDFQQNRRMPLIKPGNLSPRKRYNPAETRVSTAPEQHRKFWGQGSVEIAGENGLKTFVSLGAMNIHYSDDFEDSIDFEEGNTKDVITPLPRPKTVCATQRKFWGQGSVPIKAASGDHLRASVSNIKGVEYSMNFEADEDSCSDSECEEIIEEIKADGISDEENTQNNLLCFTSNNSKQEDQLSIDSRETFDTDIVGHFSSMNSNNIIFQRPKLHTRLNVQGLSMKNKQR